MKLKRCTRCGLPETYETIEFNKEQICNICLQQDYRNESINWAERKQSLDQLIEEHRGKYDYDCIIPFSGGKDSTFTLYYLLKEYRIKPLVVQFNHYFMRPKLLKNNDKILRSLGAEVVSFSPNWHLVKRLMLESLVRKGDFCWHCHTGIFAYPMRLAIKFGTPLVFWGEPSTEYTSYYDYRDDEIELVDETRFNRFINLGITAEDMKGMIADTQFDARDFLPFTYPPVKELKKLRYQSVCLGSFIPWDVKKQSQQIIDELGWEGDEVEGMPWDKYPYEKIECYMQGVRDYIKYLKRGYSRVTQMVALDRRNNRMSREEAEDLVSKEGKRPHSLNIFLEYLDMTEKEFNQTVLKTVVPPYQPEFDKIENAPKTWDFDLWYREQK